LTPVDFEAVWFQKRATCRKPKTS